MISPSLTKTCLTRPKLVDRNFFSGSFAFSSVDDDVAFWYNSSTLPIATIVSVRTFHFNIFPGNPSDGNATSIIAMIVHPRSFGIRRERCSQRCEETMFLNLLEYLFFARNTRHPRRKQSRQYRSLKLRSARKIYMHSSCIIKK